MQYLLSCETRYNVQRVTWTETIRRLTLQRYVTFTPIDSAVTQYQSLHLQFPEYAYCWVLELVTYAVTWTETTQRHIRSIGSQVLGPHLWKTGRTAGKRDAWYTLCSPSLFGRHFLKVSQPDWLIEYLNSLHMQYRGQGLRRGTLQSRSGSQVLGPHLWKTGRTAGKRDAWYTLCSPSPFGRHLSQSFTTLTDSPSTWTRYICSNGDRDYA